MTKEEVTFLVLCAVTIYYAPALLPPVVFFSSEALRRNDQ